MGYVLLWIALVATALLVAAAAFSVLARLGPAWRSRVTFGMALLLIVGVGLASTPLATWLCRESLEHHNLHPSLLLMAGVVVVTAAFTRLIHRWLPEFVVALSLVLPGAAVTVLSFYLRSQEVEPDGLVFHVSWGAAILVGVAVLLLVARRWRREADGRPVSRPWRRTIRLGVGCLGASVVLGVTVVAMESAVDRRLDDAGKQAQSKMNALIPPPVPPAQNAAVLYEEAFAAAARVRQETWPSRPGWIGRSGFDVTSDHWGTLVHETAFLRGRLRQAARLSACHAPRDHEKIRRGDWAPLYYQADPAVDLLVLSVRWHAVHGAFEEAFPDLIALRRLARHIAEDATAHALHLAASIGREYVSVLEDVLEITTTPPPVELIPDFRFSYWSRLPCVLQWHEIGTLSAFRDMKGEAYRYYGLRRWPILHRLLKIHLLPGDLDSYPCATNALRSVIEGPVHLVPMPMFQWGSPCAPGSLGRISRNHFEYFKSFLSGMADMDTRMRLAGLAVEVAAFRARTGRYPATLDELVAGARLPLDVTDPFADAPMRMISSPNGLMLYSVGMNRVDNGGRGQHRSGGAAGGLDDILFCFGDAYRAFSLGDRNVPWPPPAAPAPPTK